MDDKKKDMSGNQSPLFQAGTIFPRTYRWTLTPKSNSNIEQICKLLSFDYLDQSLYLEIYELQDMRAHDWVVDMKDPEWFDDFKFQSYDGCGNCLYELEFTGCEPKMHNVGYDYSNSDVVTHRLVFSYKSMSKVRCLHKGE